MSSFKPECRKFQPNIFNKIKCSNCFRQREEHSVEALESNRASRKVSKCGYLFVAPDWDFSIPLYRTKRWQRRWFVLYDDGELTYSVDDLPATIPQGTIDMTRVLEVSEAEDVTGNQFALAITSPDRATFVKGTCREESRWWRDVLSVFPRAHKHGRHKRNATFPGIKSSSSLHQSRASLGRTPSPSIATSYDSTPSQGVRFNSCASESFNVGRPSSAPTLGAPDDVFQIKDSEQFLRGDIEPPPSSPIFHSTPMSSLPPSSRLASVEQETIPPSPYMEDYHDNPPTSESPPTQDKVAGHHRPRTRRTAKREARGIADPRSKSEVSLLPPFASAPNPASSSSSCVPQTTCSLSSSLQTNHNFEDDFCQWRNRRRNTVTSSMTSLSHSPYVSPFATHPHLRPGVAGSVSSSWRDDSCSADVNGPSRNIRYSDFPSMKRFLKSNNVIDSPSVATSSGELSQRLLASSSLEETKREVKLKDIADSLTRPRLHSSLSSYLHCENGVRPTRENDISSELHDKHSSLVSEDAIDSDLSDKVRGDPDGYNSIDGDSSCLSPIPAIQRVDLPAEEILYSKKGWLLKQGMAQDWTKHWFVLEGSGLKFYRDPSAEDSGILDGILDLGLVKDVLEKDVGRNYGFVVITWDDKILVFSAVTCGIRANWIQAMRNAANLKAEDRPLTLGEKLEREMVAKKEACNSLFSMSSTDIAEREENQTIASSVTSLRLRSRLTSEDDEDDYRTASESSLFSDGRFSRDTVDSFSKNDGTSSRSSLRSRSRSSPPPSRRSTREDFPSVSAFTSVFSPATSAASVANGNSGLLSDSESVYLHRLSSSSSRYIAPERDSGTNGSSKGDGLIVELLEAEVDSLKSKLEQTQLLESESKIEDCEIEFSKSNTTSRVEALRKLLCDERKEWERRLLVEEKRVRDLKSSQGRHAEITKKLTRSLQECELQINSLTQELNKSVEIKDSLREKDQLNTTIRAENVKMSQQILDLKSQMCSLQESLKAEKSESYKWKDLVKELRSLLDGRNSDMELKRDEVNCLRDKLKTTQSELDSTADRLRRGIEENETLCGRLRELQRKENAVVNGCSALSISSSKERFCSFKKTLPRMDSLSDLTNCDLNFDPEHLERESLVDEFTDLRLRFEKAVGEIKALKRELRAAESAHDDTDLTNQRLKVELEAQEKDFKGQLQLMENRIQDLANKLSTSDKQLRTMKAKASRTESRDRRRTLSLKGKESFAFSRDLEVKLADLEVKVNYLTTGGQAEEATTHATAVPPSCYPLKETRRSKSFEESTKKAKHRRKSLDGQPTSTALEEDPLRAVVRMNALEDKVCLLSGGKLHRKNTSNLSLDSSTTGPSRAVTPKSKSPLISPAASKRNLSMLSRPSKVKRSDSEPRGLRDKAAVLEKVLAHIHAKLTEGLSCARTIECSCSCKVGDEILRQLEELLSTSLQAVESRHVPVERPHAARLRPLALRLQQILKEKMTQLTHRRHELRANGRWTRDAQLKDLAEKLAFQTVLITQLAQKCRSPMENSQRLQELVEAHRKLSFLERKLTDPRFDMAPLTPLEFHTSLLAEKLALGGNVWASLASNQTPSEGVILPPPLDGTCKDLVKRLLERERALAGHMSKYKEKKLGELAQVMARDAVSGDLPAHDESVLVEEVRLREAWAAAQELLNEEVANLETAQSVARLARLLPNAELDMGTIVDESNVTSLDRLQTAAEESLRQEMEESAFTLSRKYEEALAAYRAGDMSAVASSEVVMSKVLGEFAAVIAQKALVDGQLAVATSDVSSPIEAEHLVIVEDEKNDEDVLETAGDVVASEAHLLMFLGGGGDPFLEAVTDSAMTRAELSFLFNRTASHIKQDCSTDISLPSGANSDDAASHQPSLSSSLKRPPSPKMRKRLLDANATRKTRRASDVTGMLFADAGGCRQCEELRQDLTRLRRLLDANKASKQTESDCQKCSEYLDALKHLEGEHRVAMETLESQHQAEMDRLRDQVKYDPPTRDSDDELTELKRRLCLLEEGYEAQIAALKKQYSEALGSQSDVCEENIRQRYQLEIEHLRELCEKGLTAMETSHRRVVSEMESTHRREMAHLRTEKEEALAEETAATLAALDAMRKAHEAEVQKEVAKFKEEWSRRTDDGRSGDATGCMNVALRHDQQELREVRREILTLSEKYSGKCLEMAARDQRLETVQRQLTEARSQLRSLEERNRLLKTRLTSHLCHMQNIPKKTVGEVQHQHEVELALKNDQIAWLHQRLQKSAVESDLNRLLGVCDVPRTRLKTEELFVTTVDDAASKGAAHKDPDKDDSVGVTSEGETGKSDCGWTKLEIQRRSLRRPITRKEVARSPSCPGLSRSSAFLRDGSNPLTGMVALRKRVFEGPIGSTTTTAILSKTEC